MPDKLTLSKYMYETIASGAEYLLPISSVCNAQCIFCCTNTNPFPIYREGFRSLEDVKKGIALLSGDIEIRMGDSLPGRISEGEALLHPDLFKILGLVREKFPHTPIQITTNGILLTKEFIEKLIPFKPMKFTISYHSDNPKHWCRILSQTEQNFKTARGSFFHLLKNGFAVEGALVPLPKLVGYDDIENTIKTMRMFTKNIIVWLPSYSKEVLPAQREMLEIDFVEASRFMIEMRKKYKVALHVLPDVLKPLSFYPLPLMQETFSKGFKNILWVFSEAAFRQLNGKLKECSPFVPNEHFGCVAKNHTYQGNIICGGLLMVDDFRKILATTLKKYRDKNIQIDLIILPKIPFDRFGDDLICENHAKLQEEFNVPVWLRS